MAYLGEVSWCILSVDDIVLINETCDKVNVRLEERRQIMEFNWFRLKRTKTIFGVQVQICNT